MALDRRRAKGRSNYGRFIMVPCAVLDSQNYASLSSKAVKLLLDLFGQYRGANNGDYCIAWSFMEPKGWRSKSTLHKAKNELETKGLILRTRQGGKHQCSLYAVTWLAIDECNGKLDIKETRIAPGYWKLGYNPELNSVPRIETTLAR